MQNTARLCLLGALTAAGLALAATTQAAQQQGVGTVGNATNWSALTPPPANPWLLFVSVPNRATHVAAARGTVPASELRELARREARALDLPQRFVVALMMTECVGMSNAVSRAGAHGPMQLMQDTAKDLDVRNIDDPAQNIRGGVEYLARLRERFHGDLIAVAAAYNAGPTTVEAYGGVPPYPETEAYVPRVLEACVNRRSEDDYESQPVANVSFAVLRLVREYADASSRSRVLRALGKCA